MKVLETPKDKFQTIENHSKMVDVFMLENLMIITAFIGIILTQ